MLTQMTDFSVHLMRIHGKELHLSQISKQHFQNGDDNQHKVSYQLLMKLALIFWTNFWNMIRPDVFLPNKHACTSTLLEARQHTRKEQQVPYQEAMDFAD